LRCLIAVTEMRPVQTPKLAALVRDRLPLGTWRRRTLHERAQLRDSVHAVARLARIFVRCKALPVVHAATLPINAVDNAYAKAYKLKKQNPDS